MAYLVDSDWVIDYLAGDSDALALLDRLADDRIAISVVTYMEVYQGVERSVDPGAAEAKLAAFLASVPVLPISPAVARRCAGLRETLRQRGKRVNNRALDLLIAATAIEHDLTLVTRNVQDYADIAELSMFSG